MIEPAHHQRRGVAQREVVGFRPAACKQHVARVDGDEAGEALAHVLDARARRAPELMLARRVRPGVLGGHAHRLQHVRVGRRGGVPIPVEAGGARHERHSASQSRMSEGGRNMRDEKRAAGQAEV
jgi:hypothetical protein